jgi:hypothetical protein
MGGSGSFFSQKSHQAATSTTAAVKYLNPRDYHAWGLIRCSTLFSSKKNQEKKNAKNEATRPNELIAGREE